ncbi:MAG TPA: hypothetical protein VGI83_00940, partial [Gemmatimonadales bacterium]
MRHARPVLLVLVLCTAFAATAAQAQVAGFRVDSWSTDDGLPSTFISEMVQTKDGYLWLAAGGSLVRFDGFDFHVYSGATDSALSARVNNLYAGIGDTLWLALENRKILAMANGRLTGVTTVPAGYGSALSQDSRGHLLVLGTAIWRWSNGRFDSLPVPAGWQAITSHVWRDGLGQSWTIGRDDALLRVTDRGGEIVGHGTGPNVTFYPARRQALAVRRRGALGEVVDGTGVVLAAFPWGAGVRPLLVDRSGRLWVFQVPNDLRVYGPGSTEPLARIAFPSGFNFG